MPLRVYALDAWAYRGVAKQVSLGLPRPRGVDVRLDSKVTEELEGVRDVSEQLPFQLACSKTPVPDAALQRLQPGGLTVSIHLSGSVGDGRGNDLSITLTRNELGPHHTFFHVLHNDFVFNIKLSLLGIVWSKINIFDNKSK